MRRESKFRIFVAAAPDGSERCPSAFGMRPSARGEAWQRSPRGLRIIDVCRRNPPPGLFDPLPRDASEQMKTLARYRKGARKGAGVFS
jgi:hypothetical protein